MLRNKCTDRTFSATLQVGVVLTKLLMDTATIEVADCDVKGDPTGTKTEQPAFWHGLVNGYDEKGKGWWKKFGMVTMHEDLLRRLTDEEVCYQSPQIVLFCQS